MDTPIVTNETTERDIENETNRLLAAACQKAGLHPSQLPVEAVEDARNAARNKVEREQALAANPVYAQLEAERAAHKITQMQLEAVKQTRVNVGNDTRPALDPAIIRARMGENDWHALTDNGRLQSIGVDPATVTGVERQQIKELFGRGCDSHYANDFFKQNAGRYRLLKNIAVVLNLQGK